MKLKQERGFTLFELIVAITIVGLILGVTVTQMDRILELDMKKTSNKLASTIRYLYNKSATEGLYIRLICDLNEQTYWVEATTDPTKVSADMDSGDETEEEEEVGEAVEGEVPSGEGEAEVTETRDLKIKYPKPSFGQVDSFLLKPTKLPDSVFFKDVFVEHYPTAVEGGKAAIYFFPNGYVEHAIINLRNEDDDYYFSIETNPISGKVRIENEYRAMEGK
jgi:prepilin-type N-terminal cleavage/methylation domain-containing protein